MGMLSPSPNGSDEYDRDSADELLCDHEELDFELTGMGGGDRNNNNSNMMSIQQQNSFGESDENGTSYHRHAPSSNSSNSNTNNEEQRAKPLTVMQALIQSSVPSDVVGDSKKMLSGEMRTFHTTLLHHASTADSNALFVSHKNGFVPKNRGRDSNYQKKKKDEKR